MKLLWCLQNKEILLQQVYPMIHDLALFLTKHENKNFFMTAQNFKMGLGDMKWFQARTLRTRTDPPLPVAGYMGEGWP